MGTRSTYDPRNRSRTQSESWTRATWWTGATWRTRPRLLLHLLHDGRGVIMTERRSLPRSALAVAFTQSVKVPGLQGVTSRSPHLQHALRCLCCQTQVRWPRPNHHRRPVAHSALRQSEVGESADPQAVLEREAEFLEERREACERLEEDD